MSATNWRSCAYSARKKYENLSFWVFTFYLHIILILFVNKHRSAHVVGLGHWPAPRKEDAPHEQKVSDVFYFPKSGVFEPPCRETPPKWMKKHAENEINW
jgi:hypothetical protein